MNANNKILSCAKKVESWLSMNASYWRQGSLMNYLNKMEVALSRVGSFFIPSISSHWYKRFTCLVERQNCLEEVNICELLWYCSSNQRGVDIWWGCNFLESVKVICAIKITGSSAFHGFEPIWIMLDNHQKILPGIEINCKKFLPSFDNHLVEEVRLHLRRI